MKRVVGLLAFLLSGVAFAQQSASFKLNEHAFNAGGNTASLVSASFRITQSAIGDAVAPTVMVSPGFSIAGTLLSANPPPREVANLLFTDATTLVWDVEPSVGVYNLYEGAITVPFDAAFGACLPPAAATETATFSATPASGEALFVFLTAENRLGEEGTKGNQSDGAARLNPAPCP